MDTGVSAVKGRKIHITGIVQGVGFRPFIYRLAQLHEIKGTVLNNSQGVFIEAWGTEAQLEALIKSIYAELPPAARIENLTEEALEGEAAEDFKIIASEDSGEKTVLISPDLAICRDCLEELENPEDRRYGYPFINCTNCGPRYSIIQDIPYDRPFTTMSKFPMCEACEGEYRNPLDRRFHAQPNACAQCGPHYSLLDLTDDTLVKGDPVAEARKLLAAGKIVAVKGIGGFHLACNAFDEEAVNTLRRRKRREAKALAVMVRDVATAKKLGRVDDAGEALLNSAGAPIILTEKTEDYPLAEGVAPHNKLIGVMVAYAPIHFLLLKKGEVLVMTSANLSHEPMLYDNEEAKKGLRGLADFILLHNREIANPVDDSVISVAEGEQSVIRRGRGYAPVPVALPEAKTGDILAMGGELKNTFAVSKGSHAFLSPHLGDLENQKTYNLYKHTLALYKRLFDLKPVMAVRDMHPEYFSSKYAAELNLPLMEVQHHHAHIASVLAEHKLSRKVLGVALDGTGYGDDGTLWGGEFMAADLKTYSRLGHFPLQKLPGGARAIKEPWRLALYQAHRIWGEGYKEKFPELNRPGSDLLLQAAAAGLNAPLTTSAGRVFDTVSALLGICYEISYEGQAAVELELTAGDGEGEVLPVSIQQQGACRVLNFDEMYRLLPELKAQKGVGYAAYSAHLTIAAGIVLMIEALTAQTGLKEVAFSGGVCQNRTLMRLLKHRLKDCRIYLNKVLPPNDGGLSYGQLAVARARSEDA